MTRQNIETETRVSRAVPAGETELADTIAKRQTGNPPRSPEL